MPDGGPRILSNDGRNKKKCRALSCVVNEPSRLRILKWMEWLAYSKQKKAPLPVKKKRGPKTRLLLMIINKENLTKRANVHVQDSVTMQPEF